MSDPHRNTRVDVRLRRALESGTLPRELLVCGPAGTGKTYAILAFIHLLAADYPGLRVLFCRKTRVSLTESVLVTYERQILPADGMESVAAGMARRNRTSYRYPNGSEIVLAGTDEPTRIGSTAWDLIFANEAIELDEEAWETLGSRLGRPGRDPRLGLLIGDTNPGDPAHWLKARCDDGRTVLWDTAHAANPAMRDASGWTAAGRSYLAQLEKLRGTRRRRFFEGHWSAGEGQWFETFGDRHVGPAAEFHSAFPVHLAADSGVHTAAVWFQVRESPAGPAVTVFGDYYSFNVPAHANARAILARTAELCGGRFDRGTTDPAGGAMTGFGTTVIAEYARAGLKLGGWPSYPGSVSDGLALVESFVATDPPGLTVHPRCLALVAAFANYRRKKRGGQWIDVPEDPQHPHEDLLDALRGGLMDRFPGGRAPKPTLPTVPPRRVF